MAAFVFLGAMVLYSAWRVATAPLITHAALFLAASFAGVAGLFFLLEADFLAAVQLLLYAGAVMTVVIFAIMLAEMRELEDAAPHAGWLAQLRSGRLGWAPLAGSVALFAVLVAAYERGAAGWPKTALPAPADSTRFVAGALFGPYALPFEVASVLLLAALVGAVILTRVEGKGR